MIIFSKKEVTKNIKGFSGVKIPVPEVWNKKDDIAQSDGIFKEYKKSLRIK